MVSCTCVKSLIIFCYQLLLSLMGICFPNKILVSGIPISYSSVTTQFVYSKSLPYSYSYQLLLSPYYTVAVQATPYGTPFNYFYPLLLPTPISYSYKLLVTCNRYYSLLYQLLLAVPANLINQSFQPLFSDTAIREHYHILLSAIRITY